MEFQEIIKHPFVWGLLLGLLIVVFVLKNSIAAKMQLKREIRRIEGEKQDLQSHLNTQMKITATGSDTLTKEVDTLKTKNENLRVNLAVLQNKPDKNELRSVPYAGNGGQHPCVNRHLVLQVHGKRRCVRRSPTWNPPRAAFPNSSAKWCPIWGIPEPVRLPRRAK